MRATGDPGEEWSEWSRHHVNGTASKGVRVELDSVAFAKQWNPGIAAPAVASAARLRRSLRRRLRLPDGLDGELHRARSGGVRAGSTLAAPVHP